MLRIGELSALTGVAPRLLRYYQSRGLSAAGRSISGQRLFDPVVVDRVRAIRSLLDVGLPTRTILELLVHPMAQAYRERVAAAEQSVADEAAGIVFRAGVRQVGMNIQPGVYVSVGDISNCCWERLDSAGEILDNNFIMGAPRVEVTVRSSDYAFNSTGCGEWRRQ